MDSVSTEDVSSNLSVAAADNDDDVIVLENVRQYQHRRLNTLIEEVNKEYPFWRPHRLVSNEEVTLNEIRTEIVSNENIVISNLNVAAATDNNDGIQSQDKEYLAAAATDDDDEIHSRDKEYPDEEKHHEEYPDKEEHHEELLKF